MRGLLADANVDGQLNDLRRLLIKRELWPLLDELQLQLATFGKLSLPRDLDDRALWNFCQAQGWVLFTDYRNQDGIDSLQATLDDSWRVGHLPVLTLTSKRRFDLEPGYAEQVADDLAELLFGIVHGDYLDQQRIYVPRS
jgi:hypothetical protein